MHILTFDWSHGWTSSVLEALNTAHEQLPHAIRSDGLHLAEYAEHTTGVAVVTVQVYLSAAFADLCKVVPEKGPKKPKDLFCAHGTAVPGKKIKDVEGFWELANFFKHRDEWRNSPNATSSFTPDWAKGAKKSPATVAALNALDLNQDTEFPISTGVATILGDGPWTFAMLLDRATAWRSRCFAALGVQEV